MNDNIESQNIRNEHFHKGVKYQQQKQYDEMIKHYLEAIKLGSYKAAFNLGKYYWDVMADFESAKKYFSIGIEKGYNKAMFIMGEIYDYIDNRKEAIKFYKMAFKNGYVIDFEYEHNDACKPDLISVAMSELCLEYFLIGREYERTKKMNLATEYYNKSLDYGNDGNYHAKRTQLYLDISKKRENKRLKHIANLYFENKC
jgi:TPR repeat protein